MDSVIHIGLAILSSPEVINGLAVLFVGAAGWALRKVPSTWVNEKHKQDAALVIEGVAHDLMPLAESYKDVQGGKLNDAQIAELNAMNLARAENILQKRGIELGKVFAPEVANLIVRNAVERLKGVQQLPSGTARLLPAILLCFALGLSSVGCASFPNGWQDVQPERIAQVETAITGLLQRGTEGTDPELRAVVIGASDAAVHTYIQSRAGGKDRNESARAAVNAAVQWARDSGKLDGAGVDRAGLRDYLVSKLGLDAALTDADVLIGLLRSALSRAGETAPPVAEVGP